MNSLEKHQVQRFLWGFGSTLLFLIPIYTMAPKWNDLWEFLSYMCPCAAGVSAGAGLYFGKNKANPEDKSSDKFFYIASVFLLFLGMFFYAMGHPCKPVSITMLCGSFAIVCWITLIENVDVDKGRFRFLGHPLAFLAFCLIVVFIVYFIASVKDFFIIGNGHITCDS